MKLQRLLSLALAAASLLVVQLPVLAQDPEQALLADFPPLSIDSIERAEEAVARLPEVREQLSRRNSNEKARCLERFFVASCLSDLRSRERVATKAINRIEVEAKAFLRRERAAERDRAVAERERRAAEPGGKTIPFSGAARQNNRSGKGEGSGEGRESSKTRIHIERVPDAVDGAVAEPVPATGAAAIDGQPAPDGVADDTRPPEPAPDAGNEAAVTPATPAADAAAAGSPDSVSEQNAVEQNVPAQNAAEQNAAEQNAAEQKVPTQTPDEEHEQARQKAREQLSDEPVPVPVREPAGPAVPTPEFLSDLPPGTFPTAVAPDPSPDAAAPTEAALSPEAGKAGDPGADTAPAADAAQAVEPSPVEPSPVEPSPVEPTVPPAEPVSAPETVVPDRPEVPQRGTDALGPPAADAANP